jgi:hypothetical protein
MSMRDNKSATLDYLHLAAHIEEVTEVQPASVVALASVSAALESWSGDRTKEARSLGLRTPNYDFDLGLFVSPQLHSNSSHLVGR